MSTRIFIIHINICIIFFNCAAQAPASGGPKDEKGPKIISINPKNTAFNFSSNNSIILKFDEMLDPVSVPSSIRILPEQEWGLKISKNTIVIQPKKRWKTNANLRINISRRLRDYQNNKMDKPIQLLYPIHDTIPQGSIQGKIINILSSEIFEIGLYKWPITDSSQFIYKVETDKTGSFIFDFLPLDKFIIIGINGILNDFSKQIRKNSYCMHHDEFINLKPNYQNAKIQLLSSKPLEQLKINSFEMIGQYHTKLKLSDGSMISYSIDTLLNIDDTVKINLKSFNDVEEYKIPEYKFILQEISDTIPPYIQKTEFNDSTFYITFSEPVKLIVDSFENNNNFLPFNIENNFKIAFENFPDTIKSLKIKGGSIKDFSDNRMKDSLRIINVDFNDNEKLNLKGGSILGSIEYNGNEIIQVQALNIDTNETFYTQMHKKLFSFINIPSGFYKLWAYESLNKINPEIIFSGRWNPYEHSAKFVFYSDSIEVRALWDVEGIKINFNN